MMSYIGNEQQWKQLIEVDWLGQYVKAWIAFNAWYRNSFSLRDDREIIDEIKNDGGNICSKIENNLSGNSSVQQSFQSAVADLHRSLSETVIKSKNRQISFQAIEDYKHAKPIKERKNNVLYKIKINRDGKQRLVTVKNSNGTKIYYDTINKGQEGNNFESQNSSRLSEAQKRTLRGFLEESTPIHNLLDYGSDPLEVGPYNFINETNLIGRAIIEILYQLRNALFHGDITPDLESQRVYQPAYLILKSLIPM